MSMQARCTSCGLDFCDWCSQSYSNAAERVGVNPDIVLFLLLSPWHCDMPVHPAGLMRPCLSWALIFSFYFELNVASFLLCS